MRKWLALAALIAGVALAGCWEKSASKERDLLQSGDFLNFTSDLDADARQSNKKNTDQ